MTPALHAACERAIHVLTADGEILRAGRASMFIMEQLGYEGFARVMSRPPMIWGVECGYWLVARNRPLVALFILRGEPEMDPDDLDELRSRRPA